MVANNYFDIYFDRMGTVVVTEPPHPTTEKAACPLCGRVLRYRWGCFDYVCKRCDIDLIFHGTFWNYYPHMAANILLTPDEKLEAL